MIPIVVWPHKLVTGCDGIVMDESGRPVPIDDSDGSAVRTFEPVDAAQAFATRYQSDAHFVPYVLMDGEGTPGSTPRINHTAIKPLADVGLLQRFTALVLDVDCAEVHGSPAPAPDSWREPQWAAAETLAARIGGRTVVYDTRGGIRVVALLATPLDEDGFLEALAGLHVEAKASGFAEPDRLVDVQRCYRLPFVTRDGVAEERRAVLAFDPLDDDVVALLRAGGRAAPLKAPPPPRPAPSPALPFETSPDGERPGDWMDRNVPWRDVLEPHGWTFGGMRGAQEVWYRPGKPPSGPPSALTSQRDGKERLYVFSTSIDGLEAQRSYDKLGVFARLEGYGERIADAIAKARERWGIGPAPRDTVGMEEFFRGARREREEAAAAPVSAAVAGAPATWNGATALVYEPTQAGNAARFVARFGSLVRYVPGTGWRVWDGRRWVVDVDATRVLQMAHLVITDLDLELAGTMSPDEEKKLRRHRDATATAAGLGAIVRLAAGYDAIRVSADIFDAYGWLLNTPGGTVDLRTGALREHRREDYLTKMTPVTPDFDGASPRFDAFLESAMPTEQDRSFLMRFAGYALTGVIREHVLVVNWGPEGRNGKTTFFEHALAGAIGPDYAEPAPREMLLEPLRGQRGHPTELEVLRGRRLVWASEPGERRRLDAELCKAISGNDAIQGRGMGKDFTTIRQTAKVTLLANRLDVLRGLDTVTWNRTRILLWPRSFLGQEDTALPDALREEAPVILAHVIRACLEWQRSGLGDPAMDASRDALRYTNPVEAFVRERCDVGREYRVASQELYHAFEFFLNEIGIEQGDDVPKSADAFGKAIGARFASRPVNSIRYRIGLRLRVQSSPPATAGSSVDDF